MHLCANSYEENALKDVKRISPRHPQLAMWVLDAFVRVIVASVGRRSFITTWGTVTGAIRLVTSRSK
jgi:hypothetical protein